MVIVCAVEGSLGRRQQPAGFKNKSETYKHVSNIKIKAYILKNIQGLSYKKISDIMEKSVASVESILFRAKNNLKNILEKKTKGTRNN